MHIEHNRLLLNTHRNVKSCIIKNSFHSCLPCFRSWTKYIIRLETYQSHNRTKYYYQQGSLAWGRLNNMLNGIISVSDTASTWTTFQVIYNPCFLAYHTMLYLRLWESRELRGVGYAFATNLLDISLKVL